MMQKSLTIHKKTRVVKRCR